MRASRLLAVVATATVAISCSDRPAGPTAGTGTLNLTIGGLPDGIDAAVQVTGPSGYTAQAPQSRSLTNLEPGLYTVSAGPVMTELATFVPSYDTALVTVGTHSVSQATVPYTITTGSIAVVVGGVPPGVPWKVIVTGPNAYRDSLTANATLSNLAPGVYMVSAPELRSGSSVYQPKPAELTLIVPASLAAIPAVVAYALVTGTLAVNVNGLPPGLVASVVVTGPNGFGIVASGPPSDTLEGLLQGRYDLTAAAVDSGARQYLPVPATQSVTVVPGSISATNVNFWLATPPPGLNLAIEAIQVQQVVQTFGGSVPAIAGRAGLLRVFVRASEPNAARPSVLVKLYDGAELLVATTLAAPADSVPTSVDEGLLGASWNYELPATLMKPGLRVLAEVDPGKVIAESIETDNLYPSSGIPLALDVRPVAPLSIRLVPVMQSVNGLTGDVTPANAPEYAAAAYGLLPVDVLSLDVRTPYATSAPALQPNDANGAWLQVLSELNALRAADGSLAHYYGVVKVPYTAGVVGISYLPSFVALGTDNLPKAAFTMVHELGHNFGRLHSPSCGAGGYDANYPYPGGVIGVYGYDSRTGTLRDPVTPDIMGYCDNRWISDYTYMGILSFRASQEGTFTAAVLGAGAPRPGLLVWGRVRRDKLELEPAYQVVAPPSLPAAAGPHRIEVIGASGQVLVGLSFRGNRPVDVPDTDEEYFAYVIPLDALGNTEPARLRLSSMGRRAELATDPGMTPAQLADAFAPAVERLSSTRVRVSWRDAPGRGVLIRDPATGEILALGRGGRAVVRMRGARVDLTLSDGVRSGQSSVLVR
jgi:hypothetical protein